MSGSSWVSSPPCHNVLCWSAVWGSEGYDCAYCTGFKEFSFCVYAGVKPKHSVKTQSAKTHSDRIHCVPGHLLKLIQGFDGDHMCAECLPPCGQKTYYSVLYSIPITRRNFQSDAGQSKNGLKKTGLQTKLHLMLNKYKLAKMQRCSWFGIDVNVCESSNPDFCPHCSCEYNCQVNFH